MSRAKWSAGAGPHPAPLPCHPPGEAEVVYGNSNLIDRMFSVCSNANKNTFSNFLLSLALAFRGRIAPPAHALYLLLHIMYYMFVYGNFERSNNKHRQPDVAALEIRVHISNVILYQIPTFSLLSARSYCARSFKLINMHAPLVAGRPFALLAFPCPQVVFQRLINE